MKLIQKNYTKKLLPPPSKDEIKKIYDEYISKNSTPTGIVFEITDHCPNNCAHCYADRIIGKGKTMMSPETYRNWLEVLSSYPDDKKPKQIWLVGGEPTESPYLSDFIRESKEKGFEAVLVTTGERLRDEEYCQKIASNLDEVDVTIRGFGGTHDVMMLPKNNAPLLSSIPENISPKEQIMSVIQEIAIDKNEDTKKYTDITKEHFSNTIKGLLNIAKAKQNNPNLKIALNIDLQEGTDLEQIIYYLNTLKIPIDNIILQVQTFPETNQQLANVYPNKWRVPTTDMIKSYYLQTLKLRRGNIFSGEINIIDPLPINIVENLVAQGINLNENKFYLPAKTPAISPWGKLRPDVLLE